MTKKGKAIQSDPAGDRGPGGGLSQVVKWVGAATAVLSLAFAVQRAVQMVTEVREQKRQVAELRKVAKLQQGAADYEGAWASLGKALEVAEAGGTLAKLTGQLSAEAAALRAAQEDLAMEWVRKAVRPEGRTFSQVVDPLVSVLTRGAASAAGARRGDLLAHVGWANFLRWRDGSRPFDPALQYREAVAADPANPYAHAWWGHWLLWGGERSLDEATPHFAAALASGRAGAFVREIQLAALRNLGGDGDSEFLRVVNEMRRLGEPVDPATRNRAFSVYRFSCRPGTDRFRSLLAALPAAEHLATFRALFYDEGFDQNREARDACLAALTEAAGRPEGK